MFVENPLHLSEKHTLKKTVILSMFPGVLIILVIVMFSLIMIQHGLPYQFVIYVPSLLVVLPVELGYLLYLGKQKNGKISLDQIISFRNILPAGQMVAYVLVLTAWNIIVFTLMAPVEKVLIDKLFFWMPFWLLPSPNPVAELVQLAGLYGKAVVVTVLSIGVVLNGIVTPLTEELYFRGFLLPRLSDFKRLAPLINVVLFAFYHLFSPWKFVTITVALLPAVYLAWKKECIYITILTHVILNTFGILSGLAVVLATP